MWFSGLALAWLHKAASTLNQTAITFDLYFQFLRNLDYFAAELIRIKMVPRVLPWCEAKPTLQTNFGKRNTQTLHIPLYNDS